MSLEHRAALVEGFRLGHLVARSDGRDDLGGWEVPAYLVMIAELDVPGAWSDDDPRLDTPPDQLMASPRVFAEIARRLIRRAADEVVALPPQQRGDAAARLVRRCPGYLVRHGEFLPLALELKPQHVHFRSRAVGPPDRSNYMELFDAHMRLAVLGIPDGYASEYIAALAVLSEFKRDNPPPLADLVMMPWPSVAKVLGHRIDHTRTAMATTTDDGHRSPRREHAAGYRRQVTQVREVRVAVTAAGFPSHAQLAASAPLPADVQPGLRDCLAARDLVMEVLAHLSPQWLAKQPESSSAEYLRSAAHRRWPQLERLVGDRSVIEDAIRSVLAVTPIADEE